jgi:hypothetical protein
VKEITSDEQFWAFLGTNRPKLKLTAINGVPVDPADTIIIDVAHYNYARFFRYGYPASIDSGIRVDYTFWDDGTFKEIWYQDEPVWKMKKTAGGCVITDDQGDEYTYEKDGSAASPAGARASSLLGTWHGQFGSDYFRTTFEAGGKITVRKYADSLYSSEEWSRVGAWKTDDANTCGNISITLATLCPAAGRKSILEGPYDTASGSILGSTFTKEP